MTVPKMLLNHIWNQLQGRVKVCKDHSLLHQVNWQLFQNGLAANLNQFGIDIKGSKIGYGSWSVIFSQVIPKFQRWNLTRLMVGNSIMVDLIKVATWRKSANQASVPHGLRKKSWICSLVIFSLFLYSKSCPMTKIRLLLVLNNQCPVQPPDGCILLFPNEPPIQVRQKPQHGPPSWHGPHQVWCSWEGAGSG